MGAIDSRYKILSLCGGGYLGLYAAKVLAFLEDGPSEAGLPRRPLSKAFSLICGTSVGGLLALGLAYGVPASHLLDVFERRGKEVFGGEHQSRLQRYGRVLRSAYRPKYDARALRDVIGEMLPEDAVLSGVKQRVLVPAVNLATGGPAIFYGEPGGALHLDGTGQEVRAQDVALATAAAPYYFPPASVGGVPHADGGLVANAPDLIGIARAVELSYPLSDVQVLSVGTTTEPFSLSAREARGLGLHGWLTKLRLLKVAMGGQMGLSRELARMLLLDQGVGRRHVVIDAEVEPRVASIIGLDRATAAADRELERLFRKTVEDVDLATLRRDWIA